MISDYQALAPIGAKTKRRIILAGLGIIVVSALWLFSSYSYIRVEVGGSVSGDASYSIINQANQQETATVHTAGSIKKLVRRGNYEIVVTQNAKTYFGIVKAGGFLGTKTVKASLEPEKLRLFVGNNPASCMHYNGSVLVSISCYSPVNRGLVHVPADEQQATYVKPFVTALSGSVEGFMRHSNTDYVFVQAPLNSEDEGAPHTLYPITSEGALGPGVALEGLDRNKLYSIQTFQSGFLAYDGDFSQIVYYPSTTGRPSVIEPAKPSGEDFLPYSLSAGTDSIIIAYTNAVHDGAVDIHDTDENKTKTEIVMQTENSSKRFSFKGGYGHVSLCGNQKLCMVDSGSRLNVHDVSGSKPKKLFEVTGIESIENINGLLLVVRQGNIIGLNVDEQQGAVQYSFGDYKYCGIAPAPSGYVLCVSNIQNKKQALYIDSASPNTDNIDKKILELLKLPEVKDVSIYKQSVHLTPEVGEKQYIPSLGGYSYDQDTMKRVNSRIKQEVSRIGIDNTVYTVVNPFDR